MAEKKDERNPGRRGEPGVIVCRRGSGRSLGKRIKDWTAKNWNDP